MAVSKVRSAASRWRTAVQRRSQRLSVARSGRLASGARSPPRRLAVAVRRDPPGAVEQREISLLFRQHGQEVAERSEDGRADAPAVAVLDPEQCDLPHDLRRRHAGRELSLHGLGDDEAEVVRQAVVEPPAPMRAGSA